MKIYPTKDIRNVGIVGHGGTGKTQLVSSLLFTAGATQRFGKVADGSTTTDWDEEEIARKISIQHWPRQRRMGLHSLRRQYRQTKFYRSPGYPPSSRKRNLPLLPPMPRSSRSMRTSALKSPPKKFGIIAPNTIFPALSADLDGSRTFQL